MAIKRSQISRRLVPSDERMQAGRLRAGRKRRHWAGLFAVLLLVLAIVWLSLHRGLGITPAYDPFAPLDVADAPTFVTGFKLWRLRHSPALCAAALDTSQLDFLPVADMSRGEGCRLIHAVRIADSDVAFSSSFLASCPLAVSYAMFERHSLEPLARRYFGEGVREVTHLGSYACRNIRGGSNRLSEHATADALDLAAITLADGRRITLQGDWQDKGAGKGKDDGQRDKAAAFLRKLRDGACRFFPVVLSPDYDAAHATHLHLGMGRGFAICR